MTELQLLADELGVSERTLRRAVNEGTPRGRRPSPRRLEISAAEKRYVRRAWPLLASLPATLRTEGNVRFALLFGSAARGDDHDALATRAFVALRDAKVIGGELSRKLTRAHSQASSMRSTAAMKSVAPVT